MQSLSKQLDQHLIDLAWSLWTELGVVGVKRQHQRCLIALEELILLTTLVAEEDPRLRDEALDWCSQYHHFVSISRLRALVNSFGQYVSDSFSIFAATLNSVSRSNWPLLRAAAPLIFKPSGKSKPPRCDLPALIVLRIRALFGVGARSDLIAFFLTQKKDEFTASDTVEIGYSKRSLADLLEDFVQSGFFEVFTTRNQRHYCFAKRDQVRKIIGLFPQIIPPWRQILEVLLPLRTCIQQIEKKSAATKMVEIRNVLAKIKEKLHRLNLSPPPMQSDSHYYWESFSDWLLKVVQSFSHGDFSGHQEIEQVFSPDEKRDAAKRIEIQFKGLFSNVESLTLHSNAQTKDPLFENYKKTFIKNINSYLPKLDIETQKEIREQTDILLVKDRNSFTEPLENEVLHLIENVLKEYL